MRNLFYLTIGLLIPGSLLAHGISGEGYVWNHWMGAGMMGGMPMIIVWLIIIYFIFSFSGNLLGKTKRRKQHALDILNESYARGDLNRESFLERKKDLE